MASEKSNMSHECLAVDFVVLSFQNHFGNLDGGSSPMIKPKGDKQVEYLDLDLDSGKSTPPRKVSESSFCKYRVGGNRFTVVNI